MPLILPAVVSQFYVSGSSGVITYSVGPGALTWADSYISIPSSSGNSGLDVAISQFEAEFSDLNKLLKFKSDAVTDNRIMLKEATPVSYTHLDVYKRQRTS